jgi:hypothetical protein
MQSSSGILYYNIWIFVGGGYNSAFNTSDPSSVIYNSQKVEATTESISWQMNKWICSVHTVGKYSALRRKNILSHVITYDTLTCVTLEDMLSEISQSQKDKYCMLPLLWGPGVVKFTEAESRMVVVRGRRGRMALVFNGYWVLIWADAKFLEIDMVHAQQCGYTYCHWTDA